jgi:hypothetical protein
MTIATVIEQAIAPSAWANQVGDAINQGLHGGAAILENATTPAGTTTNELRWSSAHQTMMRWTGTQWRFMQGAPNYMQGTSWDGFWNGATGTLVGGGFATLQYASGTVDQPPAQQTDARHPGVARIMTGAQANSGSGIYTQPILCNSAGGLRFRAVFQVPAGVATVAQRIGFHDSITAADATDGAYLEILNNVASFKTAQANVRTTHGTTFLLSVSTWYTLHIILTSTTTARCILMRDDGVVSLDVTNTATVPTGTNLFGAAVNCYRTDLVASTPMLYLDWIGFGFGGV